MFRLFNVFRNKVAFAPVDPLDDGLREEIVAEQHEAEAICLDSEDYTSLWND
ncbi:MAG: hypothetical protein WAQ22_01310 [Candidatus Saccharimonas sp.]